LFYLSFFQGALSIEDLAVYFGVSWLSLSRVFFDLAEEGNQENLPGGGGSN
jgi:hypothetical protein